MDNSTEKMHTDVRVQRVKTHQLIWLVEHFIQMSNFAFFAEEIPTVTFHFPVARHVNSNSMSATDAVDLNDNSLTHTVIKLDNIFDRHWR